MRVFTVMLIATLFLTTCSPPDTFHTLSGSWKMWGVEYPLEGTLITEPDHLARSLTITCKDRGKKGTFTVHTVTNVLEGEYLLMEDGQMMVERMDGTLFGEPTWGELFREGWLNAESYEIQPGQMMIYYNEGKARLMFERH